LRLFLCVASKADLFQERARLSGEQVKYEDQQYQVLILLEHGELGRCSSKQDVDANRYQAGDHRKEQNDKGASPKL
jgi:hypothetical protein